MKTNRVILNREFWVGVSIASAVRVCANDSTRSTHSDRGAGKNLLNDIQGLVGEFAAIRRLEHIHGSDRVHHDLASFSGPVDGADVRIDTASGPTLLDIKCLLIEPNKRYFLVNARVPERSIARGVTGFVPVLSVIGGSVAIIGREIPVEEMAAWPQKDFGLSDLAIGIPIGDACWRYFSDDWGMIQHELEEGRNTHGHLNGDLDAIAERAKARYRSGWRPQVAEIGVHGIIGSLIADMP